MKLLIISPTQGHYGGLEAFVIAVAAAARQWPEFEVRICFKLVLDLELKEDLKTAANSVGCPVNFVRSGEAGILKLIRWADVVHGQNTSPDIIFPAKFWRKSLVLTIHNWRRPGLSVRGVLWWIGARLADRRWYNSRFVWDTWEPKKKLKGSDCVPTVSQLPQAWCPPGERRGFLFLGRWIENKGLEELIAAYARVQPDIDRWPLRLVGDGPLRPKILDLIARLGVGGIELPGFIDSQSKVRHLASARWVVAPARTREDLGLTPIEARSVGVPVIVTRDGGLPEAGGDAAIIVEPGNVEDLAKALQTAIDMSEEEYCERGERGRSTLKNYLRTMDFYRESYKAVYQRKSK